MEPQVFQDSDMFILPQSPSLAYHRRHDQEKLSVHCGQRKLLLSEIQFLTRFWDPQSIPNPLVVYAGAAPGIHIPFLSSLLPQITFHLYDPAHFALRPSSKIQLFQRIFRDSDAKKYHKNNSILFFISDIRTADHHTMSESENEFAVDDDMRKQQKWYNIMQPQAALLKFRLPYAYPTVPRDYSYLSGYLFKQVWAPQTTTEIRLVPFNSSEISYDIEKFGNQMFYHNTILRERTSFLNPLTQTLTPCDPPELLNDFDSVAELSILTDYLRKNGKFTNEHGN